MRREQSVRLPAVAGMFYPEDPQVLGNKIDELLKDAKPPHFNGNIVAIIVPHAGYIYSGPTAASAYKLLSERHFDTAVIVSPSHREYFDGISIFDGTGYRTPLGDVLIDDEMRKSLVKENGVLQASSVGHGAEHAVEVQIPFLQKISHDFNIVPIVMGDQRREYCELLGRKLAIALRGKNALLIASSDLSHYHLYETASQLDKIIIDEVAQYDDEKLMDDLETEQVEACGGGPMVAVLRAARTLGADTVKILHHCNSGDITGDRSGVVGYLSAAIVSTTG